MSDTQVRKKPIEAATPLETVDKASACEPNELLASLNSPGAASP